MTSQAPIAPMDHLSRLREFEVLAVLPMLGAPSALLELGGGTGFQASILASRGFAVRSVEVRGGGEVGRDFPVETYDGRTLPFPDASFDCVFSSNVLEHVADLQGLLAECARVLRPGGRMVHVMPSPSWRLWTSLSHYAYLVKFVMTRGNTGRSSAPAAGRGGPRKPLMHYLRRAAFSGPHGEFPNALVELWEYRAARWIGRFAAAGWKTPEHRPLGIFYTGYEILPRMTMDARRAIARVLGSSTHAFRVERA